MVDRSRCCEPDDFCKSLFFSQGKTSLHIVVGILCLSPSFKGGSMANIRLAKDAGHAGVVMLPSVGVLMSSAE